MFRYHDTFPEPTYSTVSGDSADYTNDVLDADAAIIGEPAYALAHQRRWEAVGANQLLLLRDTKTKAQKMEMIRLHGRARHPQTRRRPDVPHRRVPRRASHLGDHVNVDTNQNLMRTIVATMDSTPWMTRAVKSAAELSQGSDGVDDREAVRSLGDAESMWCGEVRWAATPRRARRTPRAGCVWSLRLGALVAEATVPFGPVHLCGRVHRVA